MGMSLHLMAMARNEIPEDHSAICAILEQVVVERTEIRAYFLSRDSFFLTQFDSTQESTLQCWLSAEAEERRQLRQEVRLLAYKFWEEECHRVGDEPVHTNDWHHWFLAERHVAKHHMNRLMNEAVEDYGFRPKNPRNESCVDSPVVTDSGANASDHEGCEKAHMEGFEMIMPRDQSGRDEREGSIEPVANLDGLLRENKIVITDEAETCVLAVAKDIVEAYDIVASESFQADLRERFGETAEYVIHG